MKAFLLAAATGLALAGAAHAQDPDSSAPQPAGDQTAARALTDDLNGPPAGARTQPAPTPTPRPAQPVAQPSPPPASTQPAPQPTAPQPTPPARTQPAPATTQPAPTPARAMPAQATPAPAQPAPRTPPPSAQPTPAPTQPAPAAAQPATTPAPAPAAAATAAPAATPPQPVAVDSLPFRIDLPTGFSVFRTQRGEVATYTVRRGDAAYLMVFVGPQSQFPIYDGRLVERGGRSSMIITEDGQNRAVEHLFRHPTSRVETHVLVSTVADDQRAQADAIAQSVDPK